MESDFIQYAMLHSVIVYFKVQIIQSLAFGSPFKLASFSFFYIFFE